MRLDAEFCLAGYFSAWQAGIAAALPNCIYWKRKRGNPISHLSNLLSSSDPLFSAHFKIFQHQKYWHTNPIGIINFAARIYIYADQYIYQQDKVNYAVSEKDMGLRWYNVNEDDGLYWPVLACSGLLWTELGSTWLYRAIQGSTGLCWALMDCTGLYWVVLGCTGLYWAILGCTVIP